MIWIKLFGAAIAGFIAWRLAKKYWKSFFKYLLCLGVIAMLLLIYLFVDIYLQEMTFNKGRKYNKKQKQPNIIEYYLKPTKQTKDS